MSEKDVYLSWLNDAYAMEQNVEEMLERQVDQAKDYPDIQNKIQQHLDVTRSQAERVKSCIERNGGKVSALKSGMANMMGSVSGAGAGMAKDRLVKNAITDFGIEHFEAASYQSLRTAAEQLGDFQTAQICQDIIGEELGMADWLSQQISPVSQISLKQAA